VPLKPSRVLKIDGNARIQTDVHSPKKMSKPLTCGFVAKVFLYLEFKL